MKQSIEIKNLPEVLAGDILEAGEGVVLGLTDTRSRR